MPELETPVADKPVVPKEPTIKMGVPLSRQTAQLTKLLQQAPSEKPKEEPKPEEPVEEPKTPPAPRNEPDSEPEPTPEPVQLGPVEKYILDKLPTLTTRIKDGDSVKVIRFKDVSELPAGFELADDSARAQFTLDIANQLDKAKTALSEYRQQELNESVRKFDEQEAKDVAADLRRLQRKGIIPKFEKSETDDDFNDDPAVKTANAVYKLFKDTNEAYRRAGKVYRITYEDAADKYFAGQTRANAANESQKAAEQPKEVKKPEKKEPTPAQKERAEVAKKSGAPSGGEPASMKPKVRSGMRMSDIVKLANAGRI